MRGRVVLVDTRSVDLAENARNVVFVVFIEEDDIACLLRLRIWSDGVLNS